MRKPAFHFFIEFLDVFFEADLFGNVGFVSFDDIVEPDLVALPVGADGLVKGDFLCGFLPGTEVHEDFIFNAARRIGGQPVPFAGVKSSDRFDEADRSDGEQILRVFVEVLVFFDYMGYKAQISFNQDVFCFEISFCIFLDIVFFFRRRQRRRK